MRLVKLITQLKISEINIRVFFFLLFFGISGSSLFSQDNSPYSRYGLGDLVSPTNVTMRGMGGISAGFTDVLSINYSNPATYAYFESWQEATTRKMSSGRVLLDAGINIDSRTLKENNPVKKFTAHNFLFSYVQFGFPIKKNWGVSMGLRPVSRVSYKIYRSEILKDPITGQPIDSTVITRFEGDGGSYQASLGTGISVFRKDKGRGMEQSLSVGADLTYFFGKKENSTKRELGNNIIRYQRGNFLTRTNYNTLYVSGGIIFKTPVVNTSEKSVLFTAGAYGHMRQNMSATQDRIKETFYYDPSLGNIRVDSVEDIKNIEGKIVYPASFTAGFTLQQFPIFKKRPGWLIGADFHTQRWDEYRFYNLKDSVGNRWEVRIGAQINPTPREPYFSRAAYRLGFFYGPDYLRVRGKIMQYGFTFGLGLPVGNYNRLVPNQTTLINLSFEYIRRGNNNNLLSENLFRISAGFSLSDVWFFKRKYE
ncbi:MAG: hypothetical protein N2747_04270 [Chitinophagaceae bacterium]|nr:hypothetical protein [Chitinophagaceae bacterium]